MAPRNNSARAHSSSSGGTSSVVTRYERAEMKCRKRSREIGQATPCRRTADNRHNTHPPTNQIPWYTLERETRNRKDINKRNTYTNTLLHMITVSVPGFC